MRSGAGPLVGQLCGDLAPPAPSSPDEKSSGTKASSKTTSLKWWVPSSSGMGRTVTPGADRSTMNWLRPA